MAPTLCHESHDTSLIQPLPITHIYSPELPSTPVLLTRHSNLEQPAPESISVSPFPEIPPIFDNPSSTDDAIDTPFLDAWNNHLRAQVRQIDTERVSVHAPSVQVAAHGLWSAIMALSNNKNLPDPEAGCEINHFSAEAIMNGSPRFHMYEATHLLL